MTNKLNLLTFIVDLPRFNEGESYYITTDYQKIYNMDGVTPVDDFVLKEIHGIVFSHKSDKWVEIVESEVDDPRPNLQDHPAFKDNYLLLTIEEAIDLLDWEVVERFEDGFVKNISSHGDPKNIHFEGILGVDRVYCSVDGKEIENATGILQTSNSTAGMINTEDYRVISHRIWISNSYDKELDQLVIDYRKLKDPQITLKEYITQNK